ncbi:hypothetical protein MLD63_05185 [Paracoccus sp. TK19116]|uniref:VPLPA-CTERM sorting domain-containing protein n=1 Tax=Paracoccus albicereus TaxID=2922394 RepID=A0ABT1MNS1_9RHOB|nr:hypothetical protein [Paracoccus albicereus]MCQ0969821.1 hypothetical protein [Paracoccus albicereus]
MSVFSRIAAPALFAAMMALPVQAATLGPWSSTRSNEIVLTAIEDNGASFGYRNTSYSVTYIANAVATEGGEFVFDWSLNGNHGTKSVTSSLKWAINNTTPKVLVDATGLSGAFRYSGTFTAILKAGEKLNITFGGSNLDSVRLMTGTLTLTEKVAPPVAPVTPVPLISSGALLVSGLGAFAALRRKVGLG